MPSTALSQTAPVPPPVAPVCGRREGIKDVGPQQPLKGTPKTAPAAAPAALKHVWPPKRPIRGNPKAAVPPGVHSKTAFPRPAPSQRPAAPAAPQPSPEAPYMAPDLPSEAPSSAGNMEEVSTEAARQAHSEDETDLQVDVTLPLPPPEIPALDGDTPAAVAAASAAAPPSPTSDVSSIEFEARTPEVYTP